MPDVRFEVDIQVHCSCGKGLCNQSDGGEGEVTVTPCEDCLSEAKDEGHAEGYYEGKLECEEIK